MLKIMISPAKKMRIDDDFLEEVSLPLLLEQTEQIMEYLAGLPEDTDGVTCTDIFKSVPSLAAFSTQKAAALVRMLKLDGRVTCQEKKGKSLFKMA